MRALNSDFWLIDLKSSWYSANQIPISSLTYIQSSNLISTFSASFRRTRRVQRGVSSSRTQFSDTRNPGIRRPSDRFLPGNGSVSNSSNVASTLRDSELGMFLELLPLRMRRELYRHDKIRELIEIVMDLGRKPLARFPSGDWVISEKPIEYEDLQHAISKV